MDTATTPPGHDAPVHSSTYGNITISVRPSRTEIALAPSTSVAPVWSGPEPHTAHQVVIVSFTLTNTGTSPMSQIAAFNATRGMKAACPNVTLAVGGACTCTLAHNTTLGDFGVGAIDFSMSATAMSARTGMRASATSNVMRFATPDPPVRVVVDSSTASAPAHNNGSAAVNTTSPVAIDATNSFSVREFFAEWKDVIILVQVVAFLFMLAVILIVCCRRYEEMYDAQEARADADADAEADTLPLPPPIASRAHTVARARTNGDKRPLLGPVN
jgi:hypothetical protein